MAWTRYCGICRTPSDMWLQVIHILQNSQNFNTKFFALQLQVFCRITHRPLAPALAQLCSFILDRVDDGGNRGTAVVKHTVIPVLPDPSYAYLLPNYINFAPCWRKFAAKLKINLQMEMSRDGATLFGHKASIRTLLGRRTPASPATTVSELLNSISAQYEASRCRNCIVGLVYLDNIASLVLYTWITLLRSVVAQ